MRWGVGRDDYRVPPGLYAIGAPAAASPVVVTANYKLTFDLVRRALAGRDLWLLVLETHGVNVWCAAGKGTFGTRELVARVAATRLAELSTERELILPVLGATGVCAAAVKKQSGFRVRFAVPRIDDLPAWLDHGGTATPAMRELTFAWRERLELTPIELVHGGRAALPVLAAVFAVGGLTGERALAGGSYAALAFAAAFLAGTVLMPLLLPWLPCRSFAAKGALLGLAGVAAWLMLGEGGRHWHAIAAHLLLLPPVTSFFALSFTGSTPYTSRSGVKREIRWGLPLMAVSVVMGGIMVVLGLVGL